MWAVYQYVGTKIRFYTKAGITMHPKMVETVTFVGHANTREEAVDLIWKERRKPGPNG